MAAEEPGLGCRGSMVGLDMVAGLGCLWRLLVGPTSVGLPGPPCRQATGPAAPPLSANQRDSSLKLRRKHSVYNGNICSLCYVSLLTIKYC